jgi:hypothetical protein
MVKMYAWELGVGVYVWHAIEGGKCNQNHSAV